MRKQKVKIKYKYIFTEKEYNDLVNLYGMNGNIETFYTLGLFDPRCQKYEIYFNKLEYKIYKKLKKEQKKNEQRRIGTKI